MDTMQQTRVILAIFKGNITKAAAFVAQSTVDGKKGAKDYRRTFRRGLTTGQVSKTEQRRIKNAFDRRLRKVEGLTKEEWDKKRDISKKEYNGRLYPEPMCVSNQSEVQGLISEAVRIEETFKRLNIPYGITMSAKYTFIRGDGMTFTKPFYSKQRNDPIVLAKECVKDAEVVVLLKKNAWENGAGSDSGQGDITEQLDKWCIRIFPIA